MIKDSILTIWKGIQTWWDAWFSMLLYGLVWILCWMTIVLGPPATFGFFHAIRFWMDEQETGWKVYFLNSKKYFFTAWLWFLANVFVLVVLYTNLLFYRDFQQWFAPLLRGAAIAAAGLWLAVQLYALPYYVLLDKKSLFNAWKNGLFTILAAPIYSLVILGVAGLLLYTHIYFLPVFFGGPALIFVLGSVAVEDRLQKFGLRKQAEPETAPENS